MKNFVWLTDTHLNFIDKNMRQYFYQEIIKKKCDGVFITGDIAEAPSLVDILTEMSDVINKPVYFVLGNHDYYRGEVNIVRGEMIELSKASKYLFWLPASDIIRLDDKTYILGQDGWADGRLGDYQNSRVVLNDSRMIVDLFIAKIISRTKLLEQMQALADKDALNLAESIVETIKQSPKKIIILTHVPPFREVCCHMGEISGDDWLPYFASKAMGDVLLNAAQDNPNIEFLVFCGHTHSDALYQPLSNLTIEAGYAEYASPGIQKIISL